jgi:hypothetical protein
VRPARSGSASACQHAASLRFAACRHAPAWRLSLAGNASASPRFRLVVSEWDGKPGIYLPYAPVHCAREGRAAALLDDSEALQG